jgi:hypothetical protein
MKGRIKKEKREQILSNFGQKKPAMQSSLGRTLKG